MTARSPSKRVCLSLAAVLFSATAVALAAPTPVSAPKGLPADELASPAIEPAKVKGSAILRVRDARNRVASSNNLKQLAIALHNYASANQDRLPTDIAGKDGKRLLSWRVQLLPYLEEGGLHKKFKLGEAWDSKHNLALVEKMPQVFASPRVLVKRKGYTVYQVFSGPGALFHEGKTKYTIGNIPDGTSNTLFAVEASRAVAWTRPADVPYDEKKPIPDFGKAYDGKPLASLMDGSVRMLDLKKISATTLRNAICPDDGQVLGTDW